MSFLLFLANAYQVLTPNQPSLSSILSTVQQPFLSFTSSLSPTIQSTKVQTSTPNQPSLSSLLSTAQQPFLSFTSSLPPSIKSTTVQTSSPPSLSSIDTSSTAGLTLPLSKHSRVYKI